MPRFYQAWPPTLLKRFASYSAPFKLTHYRGLEGHPSPFVMANKWRTCYIASLDEPRKHAMLIAASILAARKLSQYDAGKMVPATVAAISDGVRWAEEILKEIDRKFPAKKL